MRVMRPLSLMTAILAVLAFDSDGARAQAAAASGAGPSGPATTPIVTTGEIDAHIRYLASDGLAGRRAGTPGAERAARYVVRAFTEYGLQAPSDLPTYLQTFSFPVGVELGEGNRLVLMNGSRNVAVFQPGRDFLPLGGSVADRVVQPVVFAGYGISAPEIGYDDYEGIDVRGKVVLVLRWSPEGDDPTSPFARYLSERYKAATARAKGARAIVFASGPATDQIDRLIGFSVDERPEGLGIVALSVTQAVARRIAGLGGVDLAEVQRRIDAIGRPASRSLAPAALNLRADLRARTRTTHNVVGIVRGRDPERRDEILVIGAHYDGLGLGGPGSLEPVPGEIHNGADDNASGVAVLLELAQWFAYPTNRPERTLAFVAFGAEEMGLLGSSAFVRDPPFPLEDVAAMINLDMVGRLDEELLVYGIGTSPAWPGVLAEADDPDAGLAIRPMAEGYGPSDHAPFYLRGTPVLAFFTGVHEDYHRASDDPDEIDLAGTRRVARFVREVVLTIADAPVRPVFQPESGDVASRSGSDEERLDAMPEPRARIGAVPAPSGPAEPVVVEGVLSDSPAAASGIEAGDRIVRLNGRPVESVYDYVRALASLDPGVPTGIVVRRDGETLERMILPVTAPEPETPPDIRP